MKTRPNGFLTTLVSFDYTNGDFPGFGLIQGKDGAFYGTTTLGGPGFKDDGTVFRVTTAGVLTTLAAFTNSGTPTVLAEGSDNALYGITQPGGSSNAGTIFQVADSGIISTLASFTDTNAVPEDFIADHNGVFYGTMNDFPDRKSAIFQFDTTNGITILETFTNGIEFNRGLAQDNDGNFYGTTGFVPPGTNYTNGEFTEGAIFRVTPADGFSTVLSFENFDQFHPEAGVILGNDGALYGTTTGGGGNNYGAVFRATTNGNLTAVASFADDNGAHPLGGLVQAGDGLFYGTTYQGGSNNCGTLFRITATGTLTNLVIFNGQNGSQPLGNLVVGLDGALYGTTGGGGLDNAGTVFRVTTNGVFTTLASFDGADGDFPEAGLTLGNDGLFYGTTEFDLGLNGAGTVFRVDANGNLMVLARFSQASGTMSRSALVQASDGAFYGTASAGGTDDDGTVFRITTNGDLATVFSFDGTNGANPVSALVIGDDGAFYGTTSSGGSGNFGTVFRITAGGDLTTLVSFNGSLAFPNTGLISDGRGAFYGDAFNFYRVTTNGVLTALSSSFDESANDPLFHARDGWYYGTAFADLPHNGGNIFRMNPAVQMLPLTNAGGIWNVSFNGIPGDTYQVLRATNLCGPWETLTSTTADAQGNGQFQDVHPPSGGAFYQTKAQ